MAAPAARPAAAPSEPEILAQHDRRREAPRSPTIEPDRKVDLAGGQHEDHADRHDGDRRRLLDDVEKIAGGQEPVVAKDDREADEDQDEADIDDIAARIDPPLSADSLPAPSLASGQRGRRVAVERLEPAFLDIVLGDGDGVDRMERRRASCRSASAAARAGECLPMRIGLVGDDRRDIAVLDHVERQRLGEVERDDLGLWCCRRCAAPPGRTRPARPRSHRPRRGPGS